MDQIGTLELAWASGYTGTELCYIDKGTICCKCGKDVKFITEDGTEKIFAFEGNGCGPLAVHKFNKQFAVAEFCPDPKIFIYTHPLFWKSATLEGGARLEFQRLEFSSSDYLLSLSGVPEFELVIWRYESGERLISVQVDVDPPTSISFNPANWRQICYTTMKAVTVYQIEQADVKFVIQTQKIHLPPEDPAAMFKNEKDYDTQASAKSTKFTIEVPKAARAGLVGELAETLEELMDETVHVSPISQAWTPQGDIYIGCSGGQLLKIDGERWKTKVLYHPPLKADTPVSREPSNLKTRKTAEPVASQSEIDNYMENMILEGSLDCIGLHRKGLFAAGQDGVLRLLDIRTEECQVIEQCHIGVPITSLAFSRSFLNIALGSEMGSIHLYTISQADSLRMIRVNQCGPFIGVACLSFGSDCVVTARSGGEVQIWSSEDGYLRSSINIGTEAVSLACSPLMHLAVVGSSCGHLFFIDCIDSLNPRIVERVRLSRESIKAMRFDDFGNYLTVATEDGHLFIVNGTASREFEVIGYTGVDGEVIALDAHSSTTRIRFVASVQTRRDCKSATKLILFDLYEDFLTDLPKHFHSLKHDLKDEALNKTSLHMQIPSFGLALGPGNCIYTIADGTRKIQILHISEDIIINAGTSSSYLGASSQHIGHQLNGGHLVLSPHKRWLASFGPDGIVQVRTLNKMDDITEISAHDYRQQGVKQIAFSLDCQRIFTVGSDQVLKCHVWKLSPHGVDEANLAMDLSQIQHAKLLDAQKTENEILKAMEEWDPPLALSKSPSEIVQEAKSDVDSAPDEQQEAAKLAALEAEEIYSTPTPIAAPDATWLEVQEIEALKEEDQQYEATKKMLRMHIRDIRKAVQNMIAENEQLPEIGRLNRHEFDLDLDEQTRLQALGDAEVQRVKEEIELENLSNMYCRDLIKRECWDNMKVKGRSIRAFNSQLEVANFPLKERSKDAVAFLEVVTKRRNVELAELRHRKEIERSQRPSVVMPELSGKGMSEIASVLQDKIKAHHFGTGHDDEEGEEKENGPEKPSVFGSLGGQYGGANPLYYTQFELHTREQKIYQIAMLEDAIYRIRVAFNVDFDDVFLKKEHEIAKIQEKNKRIRKIVEDLDLKEEILNPKMGELEKPEMLLKVEDHEIKVEKYLTPEQRKKLEEQGRLDEERRILEKGDNARERALEMMMGGVLEIRKEDELKKDVPIPLFMTQKAPDAFNEDEQRLAKEYERKVKELNEEREKFRKQLETELRKLQGLISESMASFDECLNQLFMKKIKVQTVVYQEELKILRLRLALLLEEEFETREKELSRLLEQKKTCKAHSMEAVSEARKQVDAFRDEYEQLVAEDKVLDKSFKRDFHDVSAVMVDQLYRLFRRRPRIQKLRLETPAGESASPNPFWDRPSSARQNQHARMAMHNGLDELDKESNMPEGLDPNVWQRLCKSRRDKVDKELLIRQKALVLAEMNAFMQKRQEEDESYKSETDFIISQINKLKDDRLRFTLNLEIQLIIKQGQVEVDAGDFVHDYSESVLINRSVVEDLNTTIKQLGERKIASMVESKDFRKGIFQLEWEHKKMLMQMEDLRNKMKDIQHMKVTREIQSFLSEEDYDAKKAEEIATLERTIQLQKSLHERKLVERQRLHRYLAKNIKQRENTNSVIDVDLKDLNVCVNERRSIEEVNGVSILDQAEKRKDTGAEKRYRDIIQRRKLVDLAKAQAQEVAVLRAEVERLRMRTFPALVQIEH